MSSSIWQLLSSIADAFQKASPLANAVTILLPLMAWLGSLRWLIHRKFRSKDGRIHDLELEVVRRDGALEEARTKLKELQKQCEILKCRIPEAALAQAKKELEDGKYENANRSLARWCQTEGATISRLLFRRAEWAIAHATSDGHASGLIAAEAFAIAAIALMPKNDDAVSLLTAIGARIAEEIEDWPLYSRALSEFEERAFALFSRDLVEEANSTQQEATIQLNKGRYHLALPLAEHLLHLRIKTVGKTALLTYQAQILQARTLSALGRYEEALPIVRAVVKVAEASPGLGPSHSHTLRSRGLEAKILNYLGRSEEALPIVCGG